MKNFSLKFLANLFAVILAAIFISGCLPKKNDGKTQLRIVDLEGNSRQVVTKYPELNIPALNSQGKAYEKTSQGAFVNSVKVSSSPTYVKKDETDPQNQGQETQINQQNDVAENNAPADFTNNQAAATKVDEVVEYDLGIEQEKKNSSSQNQVTTQEILATESAKKFHMNAVEKNKKSSKKSVKNKSQKYFVQVGSFINESSAEALLNKMKKFHSGKIKTVNGEKIIHRVLLGPITNKQKARALIKKIQASGSEAILVKD